MVVLCEYEITAFLKDICQLFIVILCNLEIILMYQRAEIKDKNMI